MAEQLGKQYPLTHIPKGIEFTSSALKWPGRHKQKYSVLAIPEHNRNFVCYIQDGFWVHKRQGAE